METGGFLNQIHDEEHFTSSFYSQGNGLDGTENMLFGEMISPDADIILYDNLWHSADDNEESSTCKEELQRMVYEWQNQLTYMQEPEVIKHILPVAEKTTQEVTDILCNRIPATSSPLVPTLEDLFPLEHVEESKEFKRDATHTSETTTETSTTVAAVNIEIKKEIEDNPVDGDIDVETVEEEEAPFLMAADLTNLLEQFEATERVNMDQTSVDSPASPPRPSTQTIRDALPPEVISRIKASRESHKKVISLIPAMPNKKSVKGATRMQDAGATLSRNKLLKLVTGSSTGESVQLDHDYCTNGSDSASNSSRSYYISDSSEYPSQASTPDTTRAPEYCMSVLEKLKLGHDNGSRKDSGLESEENSDEEIAQTVTKATQNGMPQLKIVKTESLMVPVFNNLVPMVSVLKKNNVKVESDNSSSLNKASDSNSVSCPTESNLNLLEVAKKKKKLNLEEYRVRREEREKLQSQESSRANSPVGVSCGTSPARPDSTFQEGDSKEKPIMLSVEVQTQTCDFIDLTSTPPREHKSRKDRKEKRNDLKHKSYRTRIASTSSSSSSVGPDRYHSHRRKRRSRSNRRHRRSNPSRTWSRSPSRSSSSSHSASRRSRSRDRRQKWRSRSPRRSNNHYSNNRNFHRRDSRDSRGKSWQRSRSPPRPVRNQEFGTGEKNRQIEERRVIYVGRIEEGITKSDLRKRFQQFGPIVDISVHFRERADNYGFVTFAYKIDAYRAVEHGNDDPKLPRYDLCFGGRRAFCKQRYADLDGMANNTNDEYGAPPVHQPTRSNESFDLLLHTVKSQLRKRSSV